MSKIKLLPMMRTIYDCADEDRFAILKVMESMGKIKYSKIHEIVAPETANSTLRYYIRKLVRVGAIHKDSNQMFSLTKRGKFIIATLEEYKTKYIVEEPEMVCSNDKDLNHQFIQMCKKCGYIKK